MYEKKAQTYERDKSTKFINNVWQESTNERLRDRNMFKQYYFDGKKPCVTDGQMTFERVKEILEHEDISSDDYDILGNGHVRGYDGYVIAECPVGYALYYMERGVKDLLAEFTTEHDVCMALLQKFIRDDMKRLEKYI